VSGIVSMSGRLVDDADVTSLIAPKATLEGLPILMTHGTRDQIIPIEQAQHTRAILQQLPVNLSYHEYDMAHEVNLDSLQAVLTWVAEQLSHPWHSPATTKQA
jgi:phospholipase/carboxylesterase